MDYIQLSADFCRTIYLNHWNKDLNFHNLTHTEEVVEQVLEIARFYEITTRDQQPLILAAWFHDIGFGDAYQGHETFSAIKASCFLYEYKYNPKDLEVVIDCINATRMPQSPVKLFEQIICDADLYHLGSFSFFERKRLLRLEWKKSLNKTYSDLEWHRLNYEFLKKHHFHTDFGRTILEQGKKENLRKLESLINKK